jgi:hypothetical protein
MRFLPVKFAAACLAGALSLGLIAGCDDDDSGQGKVTKQTASIGAKTGSGWRATSDTRISAWSFRPEIGNAGEGAAVDRAALSQPDPLAAIRTALEANMLPPRDAVRIPDLVDWSLLTEAPQPKSEPGIFLTTAPWNDDTLLLWVEIPGSIVAGGQAISIEFDPRTVTVFRPLGDASALPRPDPDGRVAMLYELSAPADDRSHPAERYAVLHLGPGRANGLEAAAPKRDLPITAANYADSIDDAPSVVRFTAAVAGFAELLRGDPAVRDLSCGDVITLAESADTPDPDGVRAQLIALMHRAAPLIDLPQANAPPAAAPAAAPEGDAK